VVSADVEPELPDYDREAHRLAQLVPVQDAIRRYAETASTLGSSRAQCERAYHGALDAMRTVLSGLE
jgi:hypothetical protein